MKEIDNTGERILLEKESPLMIARHFCAYKFALNFVKGKRVLDIGCGEGYGSDFLASCAGAVEGIDYNAAVIEYANEKYRRPNLKFSVLDIARLASLNSKFDVICSFQNIEHIQDEEKLLKGIKSLLADGGVFLCSTCNIKDASPGMSVPSNKFHVREYAAEGFAGLLNRYFKSVEIFGLNRTLVLKFFRRLKKIGLFNFLPDKLDPVKRYFTKADCSCFALAKNNLDKALDFIAVCKD